MQGDERPNCWHRVLSAPTVRSTEEGAPDLPLRSLSLPPYEVWHPSRPSAARLPRDFLSSIAALGAFCYCADLSGGGGTLREGFRSMFIV